MVTSATDELAGYYHRLTQSPDLAERELAAEQLHRLEGRHSYGDHAAESQTSPENAGADLPQLVRAVVGDLHLRGNGDYDAVCPWHGSKSGRCMAVFRDRAGAWRWFCRSCRRTGDSVAWLALTSGITLADARKRLGIPEPEHHRQSRRTPPRDALDLPNDWRPSAPTLPDDWRPGDPLPEGCCP